MVQRTEAEILFLDPDDVNPGVALIEHGFEVEVLDWVDDYGPTVWIRARITTELATDCFDWVSSIVEPVHGDVAEAGLSDPQQAA
jgi:hypothetical protein